MAKAKRAKLWIQRAVRPGKRGALRRQLGVPEGKTIPLAMLRRAIRTGSPLLRRRAQFALNVRGLGRGRRRKRHRG